MTNCVDAEAQLKWTDRQVCQAAQSVEVAV